MLATVRRVLFTALIAACAPLAVGCYAEAEAPVAGDGYEPNYHDNGAVVYYDQGGSPYYYDSGRVVYVAPTSPYYGRYVTHYRTYGPHYQRWYQSRGYRYRGYRGGYRR
jgi:hypothetical protein